MIVSLWNVVVTEIPRANETQRGQLVDTFSESVLMLSYVCKHGKKLSQHILI